MNPNDEYDPTLMPRDAETDAPLAPMEQPGYYRGYSTMKQSAFWDEATRELVTMRVEQPAPIRYFTPEQVRFWRAVFDHLLPQHDRVAARRIPLVEPIDERLYQNRGIGYRYEDMPQDRDAYRLGEQAINEESQRRYGGDFVDLPHHQQDLILKAIHDDITVAAGEIWERMSKERFWQLLMQDVSEAYYAHPWAWDEIGFGGPAYPRAYIRLERGEPEPWEVEERRYEWKAPRYAVSDETEPRHELHTESSQSS